MDFLGGSKSPYCNAHTYGPATLPTSQLIEPDTTIVIACMQRDMMFARRHSGQTALRAGRSLLPQYHPMTQPVLPASLRTMQTVINLQSKENKEQAIDFERQILNPERTETCKSGSDDEVGHHKCSYDPSTTTPESEYLADEAESLLDGKGHHPLFISPANVEVSHYIDPMSEGVVQGAARLGPSGKGWTRKHREVHIKDVPGSQYERYEKLLRELRKPKQSETR